MPDVGDVAEEEDDGCEDDEGEEGSVMQCVVVRASFFAIAWDVIAFWVSGC